MEDFNSDAKTGRSSLRQSKETTARCRDFKRARAAGWFPVGARRISAPFAGATANERRARRIQRANAAQSQIGAQNG
jgi:hypothetical protein